MKTEILALRKLGNTYAEIVSALGCAKSTVAYHCSAKVRLKFKNYRNKNRRLSIRKIKEQAGGKCCICGYSKCLEALHFHHTAPKNKNECVSRILHKKGLKAALEEAKLCKLVCANCHAELHILSFNPSVA